MNTNLSVILPCAGEGKRLGLDYPKELYEIDKGFKLIDFSLSHITHHLRKNENVDKINVITVIKEGKESVFEYIKERLFPIMVTKVYFDDKYFEWPGSVYSANNYFSENNFVLLPDSVIILSKDNPFERTSFSLIELVNKRLEFNKSVFGAIYCNETERIKNLGACKIADGFVREFQDKPKRSLQRFNAFWGCYGFKKDTAKHLYTFLKNSVRHKYQDYKKSCLYPINSFEIESYYDLGTWESIKKFKDSKVLPIFL